nr:PREDICTED: uncharacterized protein LOC107398507 [Tribolium castaneum]|eukprot:XP_015838287.1 PREDICTED: uncharacterized protein LOC107398507 [Tribolium castaneum]
MESKKLSQISNLIAAFSLAGCLFGISIIFHLFTGQLIQEYYFRIGLTSLAAIATFSAFIYTGQSTEVQIELVDNAIDNLCWYNFNRSNKLLYLIAKADLARVRKIKFSGQWAVNYDLGFAIVKGIYSIISVVVSMW